MRIEGVFTYSPDRLALLPINETAVSNITESYIEAPIVSTPRPARSACRSQCIVNCLLQPREKKYEPCD